MSKKKCSTKRSFELAKQLHEQYAINTNERTSSFVAFIAAIIALFGGWGYVYVHTVLSFSTDGNLIDWTNKMMTLEALLLISVFVELVLYFLARISLHLGYSNRRDQMVIHEIRTNFTGEKNFAAIYDDPNQKNCSDFIPDYFDLFYKLFLYCQLFVFGCVSLKVWALIGCIYIVSFLLISIYLIYWSIKSRCDLFKKYIMIIRNNHPTSEIHQTRR
jgi:hypothetical protein